MIGERGSVAERVGVRIKNLIYASKEHIEMLPLQTERESLELGIGGVHTRAREPPPFSKIDKAEGEKRGVGWDGGAQNSSKKKNCNVGRSATENSGWQGYASGGEGVSGVVLPPGGCTRSLTRSGKKRENHIVAYRSGKNMQFNGFDNLGTCFWHNEAPKLKKGGLLLIDPSPEEKQRNGPNKKRLLVPGRG